MFGVVVKCWYWCCVGNPDVGPMVNTTCTYDQAMRAVHAENPMAAQYLDQSPPNLQFLRQFMASTPDERLNLLKAIQNNPGADQAFPIFRQMMIDCKTTERASGGSAVELGPPLRSPLGHRKPAFGVAHGR